MNAFILFVIFNSELSTTEFSTQKSCETAMIKLLAEQERTGYIVIRSIYCQSK